MSDADNGVTDIQDIGNGDNEADDGVGLLNI